jgi:hypothetical protein
MTTTVIKRGPLFDGRAAFAMRQYIPAMVEEVGKAAEDLVRGETGIFKNPTGHYEGQITWDRSSPTHGMVTDHNTVYGPWLEGVGSRNATSRFKGYHLWRKGYQQAERVADRIAERLMGRYVRKMN